MKKGKEIMLTDSMEGLQEKAINYNDYEVNFRRWFVSQIDSGNLNTRVIGSLYKNRPISLIFWYFSSFSLRLASRKPGLGCFQPTFL
jgi:hypothetical protein